MILFNNLILFINIFNVFDVKINNKIYSKNMNEDDVSYKYYYDEKKKIYIKRINSKYAGYDMRNISESNNVTIENMNKFFYKKYILDKLNNNSSMATKLKYINEYNKMFSNINIYPNILNGGLMDDWDFI